METFICRNRPYFLLHHMHFIVLRRLVLTYDELQPGSARERSVVVGNSSAYSVIMIELHGRNSNEMLCALVAGS